MWTKLCVFRVAFAVILIAGLPPVGCTPAGKPPVVGDQTIWNIAAGRAEVASAVIPPGVNAACNQGRVLIVAAAGGSSPAVYAGDLSKSGVIQNITPQDSAAFSLTADDRLLAADIVLATLPQGRVLMVYQGGSISPLSPQPLWWNDFAGQPIMQPGDRGAIFVWRTSDCGKTWDRFPDIDAGKVLSGRCAWPQKQASGAPGRGGFDREELYVDPWNGRVFLTTGCMNGGYKTYTKQHADLLFISSDDGKTWSVSSAEFPRWTPLAMTSVPSGRMFFAHCTARAAGSGLTVGLYWLDSPWQTKQGGVEIYYADPNDSANHCAQVKADSVTAKITQPGVIPISVSRLKSDSTGDFLRLTYPAVSGGRQVQRVVNIAVAPDGKVVSLPIRTIVAEDSAGSVLQAAFVETDRFQMQKETNAALLYWLETTAAGMAFARYAVVDGPVGWYPVADLSVTGGARDAWTPNGQWMGDYMKGAFFYADLKPRFLAAWPVPALSQLRYNIVELPTSHVARAGGVGSGNAKEASPNPKLLDNKAAPGPEEHFLRLQRER